MTEATMTDIMRIVILAAVFFAVIGIVFMFSNTLTRNLAVRERLREIGGGAGKSTESEISLRSDDRSEWSKLLDRIEHSGLSLVDTKDGDLRKRLAAAGYTSRDAPRLFTLIRLLLTLGLPAVYVTLSLLSKHPPSTLRLYAIGSAIAVAGLYIPNLFVAARADRRKAEIVNGFPDALDLMLVCIEAGLGMEAALDRVGREIANAHPLVAGTLGKVVLELRNGRTRVDALRRMADDVDVDEIRSFATLLIQSDQLGSSVGQTLRVYAAEMREKRRMRAEEKAHRLPVLISIPLVTCMLPVMIGVLMLPAAIRVVRDLLPVMVR